MFLYKIGIYLYLPNYFTISLYIYQKFHDFGRLQIFIHFPIDFILFTQNVQWVIKY
jgi:hypothetical protein